VRRRLDAELVRRRLVASREEAQDAIAAGRVRVSGATADKPARLVGDDEPLHLERPPPRFVSRGGEKLDAALERFAIDATGRIALDAGASTGGFTDCLLQRGARQVIAVDVGYGQLHERLRGDARVVVRERTNIRGLELAEPVDLVVADLSFISLRLAAGALVGPNAMAGADVVLLVKPQFEAAKHEADRGRGVIKDPSIRRRVLDDVRSALSEQGAAMMEAMVSPLQGADGNVEFLAHARAHTSAPLVSDARLDEVAGTAS
jgi:23S rRNA (cytidine1920-2'-O)/16S rRNA (cytidine1409-2'-O)-methyltransferase